MMPVPQPVAQFSLILLLMLVVVPAAVGQDLVIERFDRLDTNGDGVLTPDELPYPRLFLAFDLNEDGKITREEAAAATRQARDQPQLRRTTLRDRQEMPAGVVAHHNLPYSDDLGSERQRLDIYTSKDAQGWPVIVMIHGGGWSMGDKANPNVVHPKVGYFVEHGFVFVSINYRLSPAVVHPAHVVDCAQAIAWVRESIGEYGGDPERIAVMGHSAGAHLAALVATDPRRLGGHDVPLSTISGVILLDGAGYDIPATLNGPLVPEQLRRMYHTAFTLDREVWIEASPVTHVVPDAGIAPFLLFHVSNRRESRNRSRELAAKLIDAGGKATVVHAADKTHGSINADLGLQGDAPTEAVLRFLDEVFGIQREQSDQDTD